MQYVVRSPEALVQAVDSLVDGSRFRSRNQLINIALADWVARRTHQADPYQAAYSAEEAREEAKKKQEAMARELLGEDWDKYRDKEERLAEEETARLALEQERFASIKKELREELRSELTEELHRLRDELKGGGRGKTKKRSG